MTRHTKRFSEMSLDRSSKAGRRAEEFQRKAAAVHEKKGLKNLKKEIAAAKDDKEVVNSFLDWLLGGKTVGQIRREEGLEQLRQNYEAYQIDNLIKLQERLNSREQTSSDRALANSAANNIKGAFLAIDEGAAPSAVSSSGELKFLSLAFFFNLLLVGGKAEQLQGFSGADNSTAISNLGTSGSNSSVALAHNSAVQNQVQHETSLPVNVGSQNAATTSQTLPQASKALRSPAERRIYKAREGRSKIEQLREKIREAKEASVVSSTFSAPQPNSFASTQNVVAAEEGAVGGKAKVHLASMMQPAGSVRPGGPFKDAVISKERELNRELMKDISTADLQEFIRAERSRPGHQGAFLDFRRLANTRLSPKLCGEEIDFGYNIYAPEVREVLSDLDLSNSNFFEVFKPEKIYLRNVDISRCVINQNIKELVLDGCDADRCDFSNVTMDYLRLTSPFQSFYARGISAADRLAHNPNNLARDRQEDLATISLLQNKTEQIKATNFTNVILDGANLGKILSGAKNDYEGTSFKDVKFSYDDDRLSDTGSFLGRNLNLTGALFELSNGTYFRVTDPISAEQMENPFVKAMLGNQVRNYAGGKKIAIAYEDSPQDVDYIVGLYNLTYGKRYNVVFEAFSAANSYDFKVNFTDGGGGFSTDVLMDPAATIELGPEIRRDNTTLLHEMGHLLGAAHPFDDGTISPLICSTFASIDCYDNARDLMTKIGNETLPLQLKMPSELGPQDHKVLKIILGLNPQDHAIDISTTINATDVRMVAGYANHQNVGIIEADENVEVAVFNASQAIGTCLEFPCDPQNLAAGIEGKLVVLYQRNETTGAVNLLGNSLFFGGDIKIKRQGVELPVLEPFTTPENLLSSTQTQAESAPGNVPSSANVAKPKNPSQGQGLN